MKNTFKALFLAAFILILSPFYFRADIKAVPFGNYIIFNGGTVFTQIANPAVPSQFEMEVWIKPYSVSGVRNILTITDSANQTYYQIGINGGSLSFAYRFATNSQRSIQTGNIAQNVWQKIRVSVDGTSTKLFINDVQIANQGGASPLKPIGQNITIGTNFIGEMDALRIVKDNANYIVFNFDGTRGQTSAVDSSGNNLNGVLIGGDTKIHYFGIVPTPTKFVLPTLPSIRRITLPTFPSFPTNQPNPTDTDPQPTVIPGTNGSIRSGRPVLSR